MTEDIKAFEILWTEIASEICQAIYVKKEIQIIKQSLQKNGYLTLEEHSKFIDICNKTKYEVIYAKFGHEDTEGYTNFSKNWQEWFTHKGVKSREIRKQQSSVDHILFGSTPDPEQFLLHFEHEIMGSLEKKDREQF
jgi:hypothetical protein